MKADNQGARDGVAQLLLGKPTDIKTLFNQLRPRILGLTDAGDIKERFTIGYSSYKAIGCRCIFCFVDVRERFLTVKLDIRPDQLDGRAGSIGIREYKVYWRPEGSAGFRLSPGGDVGYALSLIKQAYESVVGGAGSSV